MESVGSAGDEYGYLFNFFTTPREFIPNFVLNYNIMPHLAQWNLIQCVPLATQPGWLADHCSVSQQSGALQTHATDTFLFISHTTNVLLFKFRCDIFIGVRIIKEMPGSVASGTLCILIIIFCRKCLEEKAFWLYYVYVR